MTKGYAWVFENVVVFDSEPAEFSWMHLGKRLKSQLGSFVGLVKADVPLDPYCITYERLKNTASFVARRRIRDWFKKRGMSYRCAKHDKLQKKLTLFFSVGD